MVDFVLCAKLMNDLVGLVLGRIKTMMALIEREF